MSDSRNYQKHRARYHDHIDKREREYTRRLRYDLDEYRFGEHEILFWGRQTYRDPGATRPIESQRMRKIRRWWKRHIRARSDNWQWKYFTIDHINGRTAEFRELRRGFSQWLCENGYQ